MKLPRPVSEVMRAPVTEQTVRKLWRGVKSRRAADRAMRGRIWTAQLLAAAMLVFVVFWFVRGGARGPLQLAQGGDIGEVALSSDAPSERAILLSDGSRLVVWPGARLTPLESTSETFSARLALGRVDVSVVPGGPRRWSFDCGLAIVEVVGTRFSLDRNAARL